MNKQGGFPVCLAADSSGNIWVGTEGNGLWKYDIAMKAWTQFTTNDGLGDDCVYALAFDQQKRLWAGHLNHGVSVYNGDKWRNYGILDGPLGDRVFAIAVSPNDGNVWIATDMGLGRYSEKRQDWDYYTRASGLPSDQIQCLTFDKNGQLYAGTQCNGIAIAGPDDNYKKWRTIAGLPGTPQSPAGQGLPSEMINAIQSVTVPASSQQIIAALTPNGAAITPDGTHWSYICGQDWGKLTSNPLAKVEGFPPASMPVEDWMTTLRMVERHAWVGYRRMGVESRDIDTKAVEVHADVPTGTVFIRDILPIPGQSPLVAAYDEVAGGLLTLSSTPASLHPSAIIIHPSHCPSLPAPVPAPTLEEAKALGVRLGKLTRELAPGEACFLADDWRTQGDWIGRYGEAYVKLCGMAEGDQDYQLLPGYEARIEVGPHHETNAAGPVWYHGNDSSEDLRSLYDPTLGHRRNAEENDFSYDTKTYPESYDGPDLWVRVNVPEGIHCLSLYFLNNDAHTTGGNKYRDYDVQLFSGDKEAPGIQTATPLARTRVTDFRGGVYKQFLVCGPSGYVVRIGRNRSFVTKLQAVFIDRVTPPPEETPGHLPGFDIAPYDPPDPPADYHPTPLADAAINLWTQLDDALSLRGAIPLEMPLHIWCYRAALAGQAPAPILERFRWEISIWTADNRKKFDQAMKAARHAGGAAR